MECGGWTPLSDAIGAVLKRHARRGALHDPIYIHPLVLTPLSAVLRALASLREINLRPLSSRRTMASLPTDAEDGIPPFCFTPSRKRSEPAEGQERSVKLQTSVPCPLSSDFRPLPSVLCLPVLSKRSADPETSGRPPSSALCSLRPAPNAQRPPSSVPCPLSSDFRPLSALLAACC